MVILLYVNWCNFGIAGGNSGVVHFDKIVTLGENENENHDIPDG